MFVSACTKRFVKNFNHYDVTRRTFRLQTRAIEIIQKKIFHCTDTRFAYTLLIHLQYIN